MNSTGFFLAGKLISWRVFLDCAKGDVRHWKCDGHTLWLILGWPLWITGWWVRRRFVYWLSNDIVGLVGNLAV